MKGQAADIRCSAVSAATLAKRAQELGFTGIGLYSNRIHVDTRSKKCYYRVNSSGREIAVATHSGAKKKCPYQLGTTTLRIGSTGTSVRALQWILNWAGYKCDVDGDFGPNTAKVVEAFQSDMLLKVDSEVIISSALQSSSRIALTNVRIAVMSVSVRVVRSSRFFLCGGFFRRFFFAMVSTSFLSTIVHGYRVLVDTLGEENREKVKNIC